MRTLSFGFTITCQTFLPCYYGNEVALASDQISTTLFHSNWIKKHKSYKSAVGILLENSKETIRIVAIGIVYIDISTATSIGKSTYSLFALFRKMNLN